MAISLTKTLQSVSYTFYIRTTVQQHIPGAMVVTIEKFYQSLGHYNDSFVPIIEKQHVITAANVLSIMENNYPGNDTIYIPAIEQYLVQAVGYYQGGAVVP